MSVSQAHRRRLNLRAFTNSQSPNPPTRFCLVPAPNPIKHNPVGYWFPQKQSSQWVRAPGGSLGTVGKFSRQCLVHYGPSVNIHWSFIDVWWDGWTIQYVNKVKYYPNHILKVIKNVRSRVIYFFIQWKHCKDSMSKTRTGLNDNDLSSWFSLVSCAETISDAIVSLRSLAIWHHFFFLTRRALGDFCLSWRLSN